MRRGVVDRPRRRRHVAAGPVAEQALGEPDDVAASRSPATTRAARCGTDARSWTARSSAGVERRDRVRGAARRPVVRASRARRSCRRTPRRRAGAGRPSPGGCRSGARRAGGRPRTRGTRAGGRSRRGAPARQRAGSAGTSSPADVASQPASAWSDAPRRSAASVSAIASRSSVPSVRPRAARTVAPAWPGGLVGGAGAERDDAETSSRPGIGVTMTRSPFGERVRTCPGSRTGAAWPGTGRSAMSVRRSCAASSPPPPAPGWPAAFGT